MMKRFHKILALLLSALLTLSVLPVASACPELKEVYGSQVNPYFQHEISGRKIASQYKGTSSQSEFSTDKSVLGAEFRQQMAARNTTFDIAYEYTGTFPTDEQEIDQLAFDIAEDIFDIALAETSNAYEGDYLRYCYRSWEYTCSLAIYQSKAEMTYHFTLNYYTTADQEQQLTQAVNTLVSSFAFTSTTTEKEKIDIIYDYITDSVTYDNDNDDSYYLKYTAYAAMINKTAVCEGYAVLFYRLAKECGLRTRVIVGCGGEGRDVNHAWNIIGLGDKYYYVDATWDAERSVYAYYLKGDSDFDGHTNEASFDTAEFRALYPIAESGYVAADLTDQISGAFRYDVFNGKAVITGYTGTDTTVTVPSAVDSYPVVTVGSGVFANNSTLETLTVSDGITTLEAGAVTFCSNLKSLHLGANVQIQSFGSSGLTNAPTYCYQLENLTVSSSNPYIKMVDGILYSADMTVLLYCPDATALTTVTVADGVEVIGNDAFHNCAAITSIILPDSVTEIGYWAFCSANSLRSVTMSESCRTISQYAFTSTAVTSLHIPAATTKIMSCAFYDVYFDTITVDASNTTYKMINGCLTDGDTVYKFARSHGAGCSVPEGVTTLDYGAFQQASALQSITLPSTLKTIQNHAFYNCSALMHLTVPNGVTAIGKSAFGGCDELISILLPESIETYGESLFFPSEHTTVYGTANGIAQTIATDFSLTFKTTDQFVCAAGHTLTKYYLSQTEAEEIWRNQCTVCGGYGSEHSRALTSIIEADVTLSFTTAVYTGAHVCPTVLSVTMDGSPLTEGLDYTIEYPEENIDVGTYLVAVCGIGNYSSILPVYYTITPASLSEAEVTVFDDGLVYEGYAVQPGVSVVLNGVTLMPYEDYGLICENNNAPGEATLTVYGNRNYKDSVIVTFHIGEHEHNFIYSSLNETEHSATCYCGKNTENAAHRYDNGCDQYCNDCLFKREAEHPENNNWLANMDQHYKFCDTCNEIYQSEDHSGGTATCTEYAKCEICYFFYGETLPHSPDLSVLVSQPDSDVHWYECATCDQPMNASAHYGGTATCTTKAVCEGCGMAYGDAPSHTYSDDFIAKGKSGHGKICTVCQNIQTLYPHVAGPAATTEHPQICLDCGYVLAPALTRSFVDVKKSDYFSVAVNWAVANNVTSGTSGSTFSPADACTRAQVVTFLWRAAGQPKAKGNNPFTDVKKGQYYYDAVLWAVEKGITSGVDASHFAPDATCTRAQIVTFLHRFDGQKKVKGTNPFADVNKGQYYYGAVLWAVKNGITSGVDASHFAPDSTCTRAQVVTFLYRCITK